MDSQLTLSRRPVRPMSGTARVVATALVAAATLAVLFRGQFAQGFGMVFGDFRDGRIAIALHEHWVGVLAGAWPWSRPPWFFPHVRTLAYNDGYLLHGLFYAPARLLGADPGLAANLSHAALFLTLFAGVALLARRQFGVSFAWSLFAAATACVANGWYGRLGHVQLLALGPALLLAVLAIEALRRIAQGRLRAALGFGAAAAIAFGALMLTSGYVAWLGALFGAVMLLVAALRARAALCAWPWRNFAAVAVIGILFVLAALPAVWLYAEVLGGGSGHSALAIRELAPWPLDFRRVGPGNLLWGWADPAPVGGSGRAAQDQPAGFTPVFALTALLAIGAALFGLRRGTPGAGAVVAVGLGALLFMLAGTDFGRVWLWGAMLHLPGASGVRDLSRLLVLSAPLLAGCAAWGLWRLHRHAPLLAVALAGLILAEQASRDVHAVFDARADAARWAAAPPPPGCAAFVPARPQQGIAKTRIEAIYDHNTEAMLGATLTHLPTIAGFNSGVPADWDFADPNGRHYDRRIQRYAASYGLADRLCGIDLGAMAWTGPGAPIAWLPRPVPPLPFPGRVEIGTAGPVVLGWLVSGWSDTKSRGV